MLEIKMLLLLGIIGVSSGIGFVLAKKYKDRLQELRDLKLAMTILETKIKLTKEPIGRIFGDIITQLETKNIAQLFQKAIDHLEYTTASNAWNESLTITKTNLTKEDTEMLKTFGKMLGKTGIDGQLKEIELTNILLDEQAEDARMQKKKNGKMYQSLGIISGLVICILLI